MCDDEQILCLSEQIQVYIRIQFVLSIYICIIIVKIGEELALYTFAHYECICYPDVN
jgi:hypothetical protein